MALSPVPLKGGNVSTGASRSQAALAAASSTEDGLPASTHPFHAWSRQWSYVCKSGRGESDVRVNSSLGGWRRVIYGIGDPGQALLAWP